MHSGTMTPETTKREKRVQANQPTAWPRGGDTRASGYTSRTKLTERDTKRGNDASRDADLRHSLVLPATAAADIATRYVCGEDGQCRTEIDEKGRKKTTHV